MTDTACDKAKELGATITHGINWTWARGFTPEGAKTFIAWLGSAGYEHRGIYPGETSETRDIRFR